jgi:hypothetical protein
MLNEQPHVVPPNPYHGFGATADACGIHPLSATAFVVADFMCFSGEIATGFLLVFLAVLVGAMLVVPCTLVQRYAYKDNWLLAFGKASILAILTAIPTAAPSALIIAWGLAGAYGLRYRATHSVLTKAEVRDADHSPPN